jgi:O-Antigen ligase
MPPLIFLPALMCLVCVARGRLEAALLAVYLPTMILLPNTYTIRLAHLPELSISEICVIPLGVAAAVRLFQRSSFVLMDALVVLFLFSLGISEVLGEQVTKDGILIAIIAWISMFLPYVVGRTLIEPQSRMSAVRRIVLVILLLGVPGIFEWRMARSLYPALGTLFGVMLSPSIQLRNGHGRFTASLGNSEIAGIAIALGVALYGWLAFLWRTQTWQNPGKLWSLVAKFHIADMLLLGYIYLTQSRGPQIALVAGYLILQITRFKNMKRATVVLAVFLALGAVGTYEYFSRLTDVSDVNAVHNEQVGSALYRRRMITLAQPILEEGGWLGWGYKSIPHAEGLGNLGNGVQSIDNQFLYVNLAQGTLGILLFSLMALESLRVTLTQAWRMQSLEDRAFSYSMLAAMMVLWVSLATVYMGDQLPQIAFLLMGWSQSIEPSRSALAPSAERAVSGSKFVFRRVFT